MTTKSKGNLKNVLQMTPHHAAAEKAADKKWGKKVMDVGYTITPSLLMRAQRRLGLSPMQFNILLQIMDFWWGPESWSYPSKVTIAERLDVHPRTIQKNIEALEKAGLVQRIPRRSAAGDPDTNIYDLSNLAKKLQQLEPEFRKAKDSSLALHGVAETPKGRRRRG